MTTGPARATGWTYAAWVYAAIVAAILGHFLLLIPVQVSDSFGNLAQIHEPSLGTVAHHVLRGQTGFYRPMLWVTLKAVSDLAGDQPTVWFRVTLAAQVAILLALFVRLVRVRTLADAAALPLALAVLVGLHTFNDAIREAFPINTFMTILIACLAAANLSASRGGWLVDAAAVVLLAFAALTVESGLLVWVIVVAAWVAGLRGVSRRGVAATTLVVAAYFVIRFAVLTVGAPGLDERSTGFGFRMLEPAELQARFGGHAWQLYAYNVVGNVLSLLFTEPRFGVFLFVRSALDGEIPAWRIVNVVASSLSTLLLVVFGVRRLLAWRRGLTPAYHDRLLVIGLAVAGANAVIGYAYSKDVIMSPAGVFYAVAVFVAARASVDWLGAPRRRVAAAAAALVFAVLSAAWAVRAVGLHESLRRQAFLVREDWATVDQDFPDLEDRRLPPATRALKQKLQGDALWSPVPPQLDWSALPRDVFDQDY